MVANGAAANETHDPMNTPKDRAAAMIVPASARFVGARDGPYIIAKDDKNPFEREKKAIKVKG